MEKERQAFEALEVSSLTYGRCLLGLSVDSTDLGLFCGLGSTSRTAIQTAIRRTTCLQTRARARKTSRTPRTDRKTRTASDVQNEDASSMPRVRYVSFSPRSCPLEPTLRPSLHDTTSQNRSANDDGEHSDTLSTVTTKPERTLASQSPEQCTCWPLRWVGKTTIFSGTSLLTFQVPKTQEWPSPTNPLLPSLAVLCRLAILGLTHQYLSTRIDRDRYEHLQLLYLDEVARLNPSTLMSDAQSTTISSASPDDHAIKGSEELRFTMYRHWNLYDAMAHSGYVASKMGIWREKGRGRLHGMLAKMGYVPFS